MGNLNARQLTLVKILLNVRRTTAGELAKKVGVSEKTVYNDLEVIEPALQEYDVLIERQPRIGITVQGDVTNPQELINKISRKRSVPDNDKERVTYILTQLLKANSFLTVEQLSDELFISPKTIERNLKQLESQIKSQGVQIERHPKKGVRLVGSEPQKRKILFKSLNSFWDNHWVANHNASENFMSYQQITKDSLISSEMTGKLVKIVTQFVDQQKVTMSDYAFQSLVIHLAIAVQRVTDGNAIPKSFQFFKKLGNQERDKAIILANMIQQQLNIALPKEELGYIQLHLISATTGVINLTLKSSQSPIKDRLRLLLKEFGMDEELLTGLTLHLESALNRLQVGASISNPYTSIIKRNYTQAFDEALKIAKDYEKNEQVQMNDDEVAYLALYLEAFLERQRTNHSRLRVIIVCSTGLGSAQLLAAKVRKEFPELQIVGVLSIQELQTKSLRNVDLVISTIQIQLSRIPTVVVSPLLEGEELQSIKNMVQQSKYAQRTKNSEFKKLIFPEMTFANSPLSSWQEVIQFIGEKLIKQGFALKGVTESAIQREQLSFTSFGSYAVPHANPNFIQKPVIAICSLKHPIKWGDQSTSIVFFIAMTKKLTQLQIDSIFDDFYDLVSNSRSLERLADSSTNAELFNKLIEKEN